jgi:hypothetical protein
VRISGLVVCVDDGVGVAQKVERGVCGWDEDAAEVDESRLMRKILGFRGGIVEDLVFELIDAVAEAADAAA